MTISQQAVKPTLPAAGYVGGKRILSKTIIPIIEEIDHVTYAEPFMGMGGVFFRRKLKPRCEVINDYSRDVATFFRILQRHYVSFLDMLRFQITTRAEFERLATIDPSTLTDLEQAARFIYLQRTAFGGKVSGRNFGVQLTNSAHFDITKIVPMLEELHTRLAGVVIECLPYADFIRRYDRPATLFYCDPPYWGSEDYYGKELFSKDDFTTLASVLASIQGHFILSINDVPQIRAIFADFTIRKVSTSYTLNKAKKVPARELIITNFA